MLTALLGPWREEGMLRSQVHVAPEARVVAHLLAPGGSGWLPEGRAR